MKKLFILLPFILILFVGSCEEGNNRSNISSHGSDDSHNQGQNCMNCHYSEGSGEGWFSAAGTVYGETANSTVFLTDPETSDLLAAIEVDELGNFHTTEDIDFSNGIIVEILSGNGNLISMGRTVYTGECNLCHNRECYLELGEPCFPEIFLN